MPSTKEEFEPEELVGAFLDASTSEEALGILKAMGRHRVGISHIWDATESPSAKFRSVAFESLAMLDPDSSAEHEQFVLAGLEDENPYVVVAAMNAAARLRISSAVPQIRDGTRSSNQHVRGASYLALGHLGDIEDVGMLANAALNESQFKFAERATRAILALARKDPNVAVLMSARTVELFDRYDNSESPTAWRATRNVVAVFQHGRLDAIIEERIIKMLANKVGVRGAAALTLAEHGVEEARYVIEGLLLDEPSDRLRGELIRALGVLGIEPSLGIMEQLVDGPLSTGVRLSVLDELGRSVDPAAERLVLQIATGADVTARGQALRKLSDDHPLLYDLALAGLGDPASSVRAAAAYRLPALPGTYEHLLTAATAETDPNVLEAIRQAISESDPKTPSPAVTRDTRTADLLALVPHGDAIWMDAVRSVVLSQIAEGSDATLIAATLNNLAAAAARAAEPFDAKARAASD
jgi:HEAT repeat protein